MGEAGLERDGRERAAVRGEAVCTGEEGGRVSFSVRGWWRRKRHAGEVGGTVAPLRACRPRRRRREPAAVRAPRPYPAPAAGRATAGRQMGRRAGRPTPPAPGTAAPGPRPLRGAARSARRSVGSEGGGRLIPKTAEREGGRRFISSKRFGRAGRRACDLGRGLLRPLLLPQGRVQPVAPPGPEAARAPRALLRGRPAGERRHEAAQPALHVERGCPGQPRVHHRADPRDGEGALRDARREDDAAPPGRGAGEGVVLVLRPLLSVQRADLGGRMVGGLSR